MKIKVMFVMVFVLFFSAQVFAADLPQFDTDAYCDNIAEIGGGSNVLRKQCMKDEKASEKRLAKINDVPDKTWKYCAKIAKVANGSYVLMEQCISDEMDAAE